MRKLHLARHPWFAFALLALLSAAPVGCDGDDDDSPTDDQADDNDDGTGTESDAAPSDPDAAPSDPDAAPSDPDAAPPTTVSSIGMGNNVNCAVLSTGSVRCWGANDQGQVGFGVVTPPSEPITTPTDVVGLSDAVTVDCGTAHCCARTVSGGASCWGWNAAGELAANMPGKQLFNRATPAPVLELTEEGTAELTGATQVAGGGAHNCALRGGDVSCWGWNLAGQSGVDPATTGTVLAATSTGIGDVAVLALAHVALAEHSCGITNGGTVTCWGRNAEGQLGDGTTGTRHTAAIVPGLVEVTALAAGQQHTCAIGRLADPPESTPAVYCWGLAAFGQAGPGAVTPQTTPVEVPGLDGAVDLAAGQSHTCALLGTGGVRCWGANNFGQLGDGTLEGHAEPADVVGPGGTGTLAGVAEVATGFGNSCARTVAGEVFCWGDNGAGQLGQGSAGGDPASSPVEVPVVPE